MTGNGIACGADCAQAYSDGDSVTLLAAPDSGSEFVSWTGCNSTAGTTCTVSMTSDKLVTAEFVVLQTTRTLTVTGIGGSGAGLVTGSGIHCASGLVGTCTAAHPEGSVVNLSAFGTGGSTFSGWGGGCSFAGAGACQLTMNENVSVSADFAAPSSVPPPTPTSTTPGTVPSQPKSPAQQKKKKKKKKKKKRKKRK